MARGSTPARARLLVAGLLFAACETGDGPPSVGGPGLEPPVNGGSMSGAGAGTGAIGVSDGLDPSAEPSPTTPPEDAEASPDAGTLSDGATSTDAAVDGVSCDRRLLTCRAAEPTCPEGEVAEIVGNCFGGCVPIDACACDEPADCANELIYTCHNFRQRCGPYL